MLYTFAFHRLARATIQCINAMGNVKGGGLLYHKQYFLKLMVYIFSIGYN